MLPFQNYERQVKRTLFIHGFLMQLLTCFVNFPTTSLNASWGKIQNNEQKCLVAASSDVQQIKEISWNARKVSNMCRHTYPA